MNELDSLYQLILAKRETPEQYHRFLDLLSLPENELQARELIAGWINTNTGDHLPAIAEERLVIMRESILLTGRLQQESSIDENQSRSISRVHRIHFLKTTWFKYAAAIMILIAGAVAYFWNNHPGKTAPLVTIKPVPVKKDILPGGNRALLTLADGSIINLDNAANGQLTTQGNSKIIKLEDGQLVYDLERGSYPPSEEVARSAGGGRATYNTMSTPKGGQYQLTLADGTKAWLNAESSITFPAAFTEKTRNIKVTGEVYLEVAKNTKQPFIVTLDKENSIQVLGTSFNINNYSSEEKTKTTLLEGSIIVKGTKRSAVLIPGQQAQLIKSDNELMINSNINIAQVMAWKNGFFDFEGVSLQEAMRQIARWYDLDIIYEKNIPDIRFGGDISRTLPLSDLLRGLEGADVHFRLEGRRLIVTP